MLVYVIDQIEHGNGGVWRTEILDRLPLEKALKKTPSDYGCGRKMFGFFPVICKGQDANDPLYTWDDMDERWVKIRKLKPVKPKLRKKPLDPAALVAAGKLNPLSSAQLEELLTKVLERIWDTATAKKDFEVLDGFKGRSPKEVAHAIVSSGRKQKKGR